MKKRLIGVMTCGFLAADPVLAADLPVKTPAYVAPAGILSGYDWTGCYVGLEAGAAWQKVRNDFSFSGAPPFTADGRSNGNGALAGGYGGCNYQTNRLVLGIEGDGDWTGINGINSAENGDFMKLSTRWLATARGRAGVAWSNALFFATAGVAFSGARSEVTDLGEQEQIYRKLTGWTVGGGLEYGFTNNVIGRVEYRYYDFGTKPFSFPINGYTERHDIVIHTVRFGITYKFDDILAPYN